MRAAWAEIHLEAIRKNVQYLMSRIEPTTKFMGVVKADAYGHGVIPVTRILEQEGVSQFAVALVQEGIELRQAGFQQPILLLGHTFEEDYPLVLDYKLMPSIFTMHQARALNDCAEKRGEKAVIHLKIDTGMGRLGFVADAGDTVKNITDIVRMRNLEVQGIFSHLATAPQTSDTTYCDMQFAKFMRLLDKLKSEGIEIPIRHIANSGATILFPHMQLDMVRPGTAIYGLYAGPELADLPDYPLYPAMEIKAKLAHVKPVPKGTKVSYTGSFETRRSSVLGVVPLGYVDGVFRNLANRGSVLLHGQRCPMVGNICMDQFVIDITDIPNPEIGDEVVLVGHQDNAGISAEEVGELAGTISIEILCGLGKRMPMQFKN
ncbi:alanine racemase [Oscillibacter sp. PC13]|uniref:alanine racemase n=1 Tax=Oscillibacter sp. PC13 TaxID=1855299 RepID=UPI0008EFF190|nr:alanine racemase [Oscillibacter sp. PC13]SFP02183.1 alanine racemase [Oscillibacter sp. PC13]